MYSIILYFFIRMSFSNYIYKIMFVCEFSLSNENENQQQVTQSPSSIGLISPWNLKERVLILIMNLLKSSLGMKLKKLFLCD